MAKAMYLLMFYQLCSAGETTTNLCHERYYHRGNVHKAPRVHFIVRLTTTFILIFTEFVTMTQHGDRRWNRTNVPIHINPFISHPVHERLYKSTGVYEQQSGFFYAPQESEQWQSCETGRTAEEKYRDNHTAPKLRHDQPVIHKLATALQHRMLSDHQFVHSCAPSEAPHAFANPIVPLTAITMLIMSFNGKSYLMFIPLSAQLRSRQNNTV